MKRHLSLILILFTFFSCQKEQQTIRIGLNQWPGYEPLYAAKVLGLYEKHGLDVEIVEYISLNDVKSGYEKGQIDLMCSTIIEMLKVHDDRQIQSKFLMALDFSNGTDVVLGKNINSLEEIKGKKIGVETGTLGMYILGRALQKSGIKLNEITIVPMDQTQMGHAIEDGNIDLAISYPPTSVNIMKNTDNVKVVFSSADIPNEVIDTLSGREDIIRDNPELLKKISLVWDEALDI
jgi:NitT/TauT family transport system substrate-binding protein